MGFVLGAVPAIASAVGGAGGLADIGAIAGVAGGIASAVGQEQSASAQQQAANYNATIAGQNVQEANTNARLAAQSGEVQAGAASQKARAEVGAIKAAQAAGNIDVNTGSAVDVRSSAAELGELNAITLRSNAAREAYGYQTQATSFADQEALLRAQAQEAGTAGTIGAATSFLGGLGSAANEYGRYLENVGMGTADGSTKGAQ